MRRFTRPTNGHSKEVASHARMVALCTMFYVEDVLARIDAKPIAKPRGPYKERQA